MYNITCIDNLASRIEYQASKTCKSCRKRPLHLSRELYKSTLFMQNKPNFKIGLIYASVCIIKGYENFILCGSPKNEPKRTQNEPNFSPKLGSFLPNKANFKPNYVNLGYLVLLFFVHHKAWRFFVSLRLSGLKVRENPRNPWLSFYFSSRMARHLNFLPSRNSREAPPPVEIWLTLSSRPSFWIALALSPPPITLRAPLAVSSATALATAFVPSSNGAVSNTPIGPFQTIVLAPSSFSAKSFCVCGPISSPIQPSSISFNTVLCSAPGFASLATTESSGRRTSHSASLACAKRAVDLSRKSSSHRLFPIF